MDNREQDKLLDALAEFAAGAGHEINNPLAIIAGRTQILLQEIEHPEHRRHLGIIREQVKRAYEMIADVRFFARPPKPEFCTVNLSEELQSIALEQKPMMQEASVVLHLDIDSPIEPIVQTDPVMLHLVVGILCKNAREAFQSKNGNVWLILHRGEADWEIRIRDDGPGIPEEVLPLIFYPYYSGRQAGRGLGFGLPKAWRIMQLLGGAIRYEAPSTFVLTLPAEKHSTESTIQ